MDERLSSYVPSSRTLSAESSKGSARPASTSSGRNANNSINVKASSNLSAEDAYELRSEALPWAFPDVAPSTNAALEPEGGPWLSREGSQANSLVAAVKSARTSSSSQANSRIASARIARTSSGSGSSGTRKIAVGAEAGEELQELPSGALPWSEPPSGSRPPTAPANAGPEMGFHTSRPLSRQSSTGLLAPLSREPIKLGSPPLSSEPSNAPSPLPREPSKAPSGILSRDPSNAPSPPLSRESSKVISSSLSHESSKTAPRPVPMAAAFSAAAFLAFTSSPRGSDASGGISQATEPKNLPEIATPALLEPEVVASPRIPSRQTSQRSAVSREASSAKPSAPRPGSQASTASKPLSALSANNSAPRPSVPGSGVVSPPHILSLTPIMQAEVVQEAALVHNAGVVRNAQVVHLAPNAQIVSHTGPAGSIPTVSSQAGSNQGALQTGSIPAASQAGSIQGPSRNDSMAAASRVGSIPAASRVANILAASQVGSIPAASQAGSNQGALQAGSIPAASQAGSIPAPSQIGSVQGASRAVGSGRSSPTPSIPPPPSPVNSSLSGGPGGPPSGPRGRGSATGRYSAVNSSINSMDEILAAAGNFGATVAAGGSKRGSDVAPIYMVSSRSSLGLGSVVDGDSSVASAAVSLRAAGAGPGSVGQGGGLFSPEHSVAGSIASTEDKRPPPKTVPTVEPLPWSEAAFADFKEQLKRRSFALMQPDEDPLSSRMDAVFSLPPEMWPVLPPGAFYCLEACDPRSTFNYLQHCDYPDTKVRVSTYFGKWGRHLVDYVVAWQPTPRAEAAWQLTGNKQPPLPWEPRQVVGHTTNGEYQYANTRMRFRGPRYPGPNAEVVEWSDAHGIDLMDTKAANETATRNSDKDREAHLLDPPRPNTWGELARRPLISAMRAAGGGTYVHHINYDYSSLRTTCGRRVPAGYFFTLAPNATPKTPPVPGSPGRRRPASASRNNRPRSATSPPGLTLVGTRMSLTAAAIAAFADTPVSGSVAGLPISKPNNSTPIPTYGEASRMRPAPNASLSLITLASKQRWRTYDVPFSHPIHSTRAPELGTAVAVEEGTLRAFSDVAAVLKVSEQELRLPKPFIPGPLVVRRWEDIPRMYAEHMEAARALMPVTELDMMCNSKLHMLIYHLQAAATLEYDRLDAKLALLPQMARLGRKSVEIDAWLQVIVEHACYLYDKIQITEKWRMPRTTLRTAMSFSKNAPLVNPTSSAWVFPDPLMRTSFASRSALNVAAQHSRTSLNAQGSLGASVLSAGGSMIAVLPAHLVSQDEWASVMKVMDTCRHSVLYDHWVRLRPFMTGTAQPGTCSDVSASSHFSSRAPSECAATIHDWTADPQGAAAGPYAHGPMNRELLDYVNEDLATISAGAVGPPPPPPPAPPPRGYHGSGPLPREHTAPMPYVHRPVRCRGAEETPLPREYEDRDVWGVKNKADQAVPAKLSGSDSPKARDAGALRFSQVSVKRLEAKQDFATSRQAEVRRSMQRAAGMSVYDDSSVPEYGSDIAATEDEPDSPRLGAKSNEGEYQRRRQAAAAPITPQPPGVVPGTACQTCDMLEGPSYEEKLSAELAAARAAAEAAESRRQLLIGNGGKSREQILEEALRAADQAIKSLQPRSLGALPPSPPDSPNGMDSSGDPVLDAAWRPITRASTYSRDFEPIVRGAPPASSVASGSQNQGPLKLKRIHSRGRGSDSGGQPEPFGLEKLNAEPSAVSEHEAMMLDLPKTSASSFGGVNIGMGGLVDYETAMARRRAIAGAEAAFNRSSFVPKSELLDLFVTYCNLGGQPELVELLQRTVEAPVSNTTVSASLKAAVASAGRSGARSLSIAAANAAAAKVDAEEEARQRIRATAWLLGVTWRRITNETYNTFLTRVLNYPAENVNSMHRTRCTQIIARALVRGYESSNRGPKATQR